MDLFRYGVRFGMQGQTLILLELYSRYNDRKYRVPVFGGTISDILSVIHEFYEIYEATQAGEEDLKFRQKWDISKDGKYSMGKGVRFKGLKVVSPGIWRLELWS